MTISQFITLAKSRGYNTQAKQRLFLKWYLQKNSKLNNKNN